MTNVTLEYCRKMHETILSSNPVLFQAFNLLVLMYADDLDNMPFNSNYLSFMEYRSEWLDGYYNEILEDDEDWTDEEISRQIKYYSLEYLLELIIHENEQL